jgi:hypothetical protein
MKLLYPSDPFQPKLVDETYAEEYAEATASGFEIALFSYEDFSVGKFQINPVVGPNDQILYRGWMMNPVDYGRLCASIHNLGACELTNPIAYKLCHYLPSWYPELSDYTPQTLFFAEDEDVAVSLLSLGWTGCFLKDCEITVHRWRIADYRLGDRPGRSEEDEEVSGTNRGWVVRTKARRF